MSYKLKLLVVAVAISLNGCANYGAQAGLGERYKDNFLLTSAYSVSGSEARCVTLMKPFKFVSGSVTYSLPAGNYKGKKRNSSGYFYYAPDSIITSTPEWQTHMAVGVISGIYLNNQLTQGNLFSFNPSGFDQRPIRITVLPGNFFSNFKKSGNC